VCFIPRVRAQEKSDPRSAILVSPGWLAQHAADADLVLLHVGPRQEYDAEHIPGARFVGLDDISVSDHDKPGALMLQMPAAEVLRQKLAGLGISDKSRIVVYYGNDWVTPATRVVFTLDYAGLGARTALLDGGMQAWKRDGNPVNNVKPASRTGILSALRTRPLIVDAAWVKSHVGKPGISVVDGRAAAFYDGVQTGSGMHSPHRTGHIAGAKSVPFTEITDDNLKLRSREELAAIFLKAGVQPHDTVVGYCHIGQQATGMLFAARSLGHPVLLYDGSFEDWSNHADYPVENPSAKGAK
jgi:thiosulfate/3-mercaptopyruvate sulfurtransferase